MFNIQTQIFMKWTKNVSKLVLNTSFLTTAGWGIVALRCILEIPAYNGIVHLMMMTWNDRHMFAATIISHNLFCVLWSGIVALSSCMTDLTSRINGTSIVLCLYYRVHCLCVLYCSNHHMMQSQYTVTLDETVFTSSF